ncbi:MAG: SDR family oxidoreductase [Mesorhizobium sp.]|nr:SDR family oxidoreductase [Mesorhizobium sp.]
MAGGTSQLGAAIAGRLVGKGDHVTLFGRNSRNSSFVNEIGATVIEGDAAVATDRARLVEQLNVHPGGLHGLVVVFSAVYTARLSETTDEAWDAVLEANILAPILVAQVCLPLINNGGSIVFIGSGTSQWPEMELGAFSVAKRMLERMAQVLAMEVALRDIRVNVVNPGEIDLVVGEASLPPLRTLAPTAVPPLGRQTEPEDVAAAVEFFLSEGASFCTGTSLTVDGGTRAALRSHRVRQ